MDLRCQIRWMIRADMKDVLDIENRSFDYLMEYRLHTEAPCTQTINER